MCMCVTFCSPTCTLKTNECFSSQSLTVLKDFTMMSFHGNAQNGKDKINKCTHALTMGVH